MWITDDCYLELEPPVDYDCVPPGPKVLAKHKNEMFYKVGYMGLPDDDALPSHLPSHLINKLSTGAKIHFKYFGASVCLEPIAYKSTIGFKQVISITDLSTQWGAKLKPNKK